MALDSRSIIEGVNRAVTYNTYKAMITLGLHTGYSKQDILEADVIGFLQKLQDDLIAENRLFLSANCFTSNVVLSGQIEPHLNLQFINHPKFPIDNDSCIAERIFKEAIENIATQLMDEFDQNRVVIQFHDSNVMLEKTKDIDPRIGERNG